MVQVSLVVPLQNEGRAEAEELLTQIAGNLFPNWILSRQGGNLYRDPKSCVLCRWIFPPTPRSYPVPSIAHTTPGINQSILRRFLR